MPKLVKGGKWTFGWVLVDQEGCINIPPAAWQEYEFQVASCAFFLPGSRRSGGFSISTQEKLSAFSKRTHGTPPRVLAEESFSEAGRITLPPELGRQSGDRLLTVRGSGFGLGFIAQGPIYEEALQHPELEEW